MTMLYIKYTSFVSCCCREDFFIYFHYKSMVDNDMPGAWPVWTPGVPLAALIKESIIHWSTQYMKALGYMVSEKKIFYVSPMTPLGRARMDPRGMVGRIYSRIYKEDHYTLLHTKYESFGSCGFGEDFLKFSHDAPGARPVCTPGVRLAGFIKRTTIHCYTQNMKALGLVVSEKIF